MLNLLSNLFLGRRPSGLARLFSRNRQGGLANTVNNNRGMSALGTIASIAAPFVIRKIMASRAQRQQRAAA